MPEEDRERGGDGLGDLQNICTDSNLLHCNSCIFLGGWAEQHIIFFAEGGGDYSYAVFTIVSKVSS